METIASRHNPVVRVFRELAAGRAQAPGQVLLEGERLVGEALAAGVTVSVVAVASKLLARASSQAEARADALAERLAGAGARVLSVSDSVMAAMSPVQTPSGLVAIGEVALPSLERVIPAPQEDRPMPLVPILAGVQDPGNLGAVVRAAEAAGATALIACPPSADPYTWKALRGAMGSTFRLPVPARVPLHEALLAARRRGLQVVAAVPRHGVPMYEYDFRHPVALMLGGEGPGLGEAHLDHADARVTIPMREPVESLNVAVSAALILYEAYRQRALTPAGIGR